MQNELFNIEPIKKDKPKYRCRNCIHMLEHQYNRNFVYCKKQKSNRTSNGLLKIKRINASCKMLKIKIN